jgi:anti-sigma regulatory factor (Ser/Thr protein kinase)
MPASRRLDAQSGKLKFALAPEWAAPSQARRLVQRWLTDHSWPADQRDDLVLATSEAVANSVEHGYGLARHTATAARGAIEVCGRVLADKLGRYVELVVRDHGRWRPIPPDRGSRGHGLKVMRELVAEMSVHATSSGTTVVLRSQAVPAT